MFYCRCSARIQLPGDTRIGRTGSISCARSDPVRWTERSGKSSLIRQIEFEGRQNLLEPDAIARRMNEKHPKQAGIAAGHEVLRRSAEYIRNEESFAMEFTLAGKGTDQQ